MSLDVLLLIIAVTVVVIALFLIPTLIQMKTTAQRLERFIEETERDFFPLLRQARETSEHLNRLSLDATQTLEEVAPVFDSLGDLGEIVKRVTGFARGDLGQYAGNAVGLWLGIRTASKIFLKEMKKPKGGD